MNRFVDSAGTGVKVCGVTSALQAEQLVNLGVDALGFNFWPKSKRYLAPDQAGWTRLLKDVVTRVAVLVNPSDDLVRQVIDLDAVDMLQLHGDETPERVAQVAGLGLPVIKAIQVKDASTLDSVNDYALRVVLLDSYNPGEYGGEGRTFPWELAKHAVERYHERRIILAGGLTPQNVAHAVKGVRPAAVDVASGVEASPGIKDMDKVRAFVDAVRNA